MQSTIDIIVQAYKGYWAYFVGEITTPSWGNYFYWLIGLSLVVWTLELAFPWRTKQAAIRKDFWLDAFYMLFNFFLFSLIGYNAASDVVVHWVRGGLASIGLGSLTVVDASAWPTWAKLLTMFVVRDFIQWNVHRWLHKYAWLWRFHQVHHSVEEMGFAAHLRYHWMETIVYRSIEYLPLAMIGFGLQEFFIVHIVALAIGHLNHANIVLPLGPLKYIFNNPQMHIWHHAKDIPQGSYGVNYGISLSVWDYLFRTAWIPSSGRDIKLGFEGVDQYPHGFVKQSLKPFQGA
ncbi:MAG: sterol desaturase family protein [Candidatus Kapabacteria bacterium]|nr:sterol desaturase family protein [Candidatus Kapabacteria bacterium]